MLGKKNPAVSHLSCCVPADFYFVEFHSLTKLMELMDTADQWGTFIYSQSVHDARSQKVGDRIQQQLAVESNPLLRPFYDLVVEDIAITGSDLFIREGSDVTLLFRYKQEKLFKDRMDKFLTNAAKAHADAHKTKGRLLGVDYVHLATPDRAVSVYSCYPEPGLHVRSNSKVALKRVLEAIQGKTAGGKNVRRLGNTAEFKYIRTLMPKGASEEDGFIYLSDPFVRHMVGPRLKLTERRRLLAYNHLRMIGHAAQMYRTEFGKAPGSLDEIAAAGCSPGKFNEGELNAPLTSPYARGYELSADGTRGICSRYGTTHFLTPCCEIPVCQITGEEADLYDAFLKDYEQYWRTYFDPIAIRVQVTGKRLRLETIVLPLIDSTVYTTLAKVLGGEPEHLDTLPVPKRNLFSVNVRLNREGWLKEMLVKEDNVTSLKLTQLLAGDEGEVASLAGTLLASSLQEPVVLAPVGLLVGTLQAEKFGIFFDAISETSGLSELAIHAPRFLLKGVGTQVGLHVYDQDVPFDLNLASFLGQMMGTFNNGGRSEAGLANLGMMAIAVPVAGLTAPGYISVTVQDEKIVDDFLNRVDKVLPPLLRQYLGESGPLPVEPDFYKVALKGGTTARSATIRFGPAKFRVHWARIGKGLYLANQLAVLEDLEAADAKLTADRDRGPKAHAMVRMRPQNWDQALPGFTLSWAENNRQACQHNLGPLSSVARALSAVPPGEQAKTGSWDDRSRRVLEHAERVYGTRCSCPDGGRYIVSEDGKTVKCSVHGSILEPRQGSAPAANSATARLMRDFADLTAALTFTKDGLRAVITIDRK
ncbi:MAG TPA: hypothetical protein VEL76_13400 [Gemmataceae bacterium]|nr:hypothetical protein [Gemmataceae bacterium]